VRVGLGATRAGRISREEATAVEAFAVTGALFVAEGAFWKSEFPPKLRARMPLLMIIAKRYLNT